MFSMLGVEKASGNNPRSPVSASGCEAEPALAMLAGKELDVFTPMTDAAAVERLGRGW